MPELPTVIIGAGPAGLTAANELAKLQHRVVVLERQNRVGGLARTESYKGFLFDLGGHRFFTKVAEVNRLWRDLLGKDFLARPRLSRIYYNRKFFYYPLRPLNAVLGLGVWPSLLIILSYLRWHLFPYPREETFEQWVTNRFGKRLFETFFQAYTEKVWGISCAELRAEWAAQRIRGLSLKTAVVNMLIQQKQPIKTLIEEFRYPRLGPGMMWSRVKDEIEQRQGEVRLDYEVVAIRRNGRRIESVVAVHDGRQEAVQGSAFISTMPVNDFIAKLDPPAPSQVLEAARGLRYRGMVVVCLIVDKPALFPDNWIYVHDPEVRVGRIQNYKNWSPDMVPDGAKTCLGLEYFCAPGDELWNRPDAALIDLAKGEIERIGLADGADIEDGCVVRVPNAYPIYDADYRANLDIVREFVDGLENVQTIGRNGLHRYNNQDHAMMTGIWAARNLALGEKNDVWSVNTDPDYHEEGILEEAALEESLTRIFAKLDRLAFGVSLGAVAGVLLFAATFWLVIKGGQEVGKNLALLGNYFPGYRVTWFGGFVGLAYGFASGFAGGWLFAFVRNATMFFYMAWMQRKAQRGLMRRIFDFL